MEKEPPQPLNPLNIDQSLEQISRRMQSSGSALFQFMRQYPQHVSQCRLLNKLHGPKSRNPDDQSQEEIVTSDQVEKLQENIDWIRKFTITHGNERGQIDDDDPLTHFDMILKGQSGASYAVLVADVPMLGVYRDKIFNGCELSFLFSDPSVYCWLNLNVDRKLTIDIQDNNPSFPIYKVEAGVEDINQEEHGVVSYCIDKINNLIIAYKNPDKKTQ